MEQNFKPETKSALNLNKAQGSQSLTQLAAQRLDGSPRTTMQSLIGTRQRSLIEVHSELVAAGKPNAVRDALRLKIAELCDNFNVGKNMSAEQIENCALLVYDDYKLISFAEIDFAFSQLVAGKYAIKIFDSFDARHVFATLDEYMARRMQAIEEQRNQEHIARLQEAERSGPLAQDTVAAINDFLANLRAKRAKQTEVKLSDNVRQFYDEESTEYNRLYAEFKKLPEAPNTNGRIRLAANGLAVDFNEFLTMTEN
jgi:hypothetical protein